MPEIRKRIRMLERARTLVSQAGETRGERATRLNHAIKQGDRPIRHAQSVRKWSGDRDVGVARKDTATLTFSGWFNLRRSCSVSHPAARIAAVRSLAGSGSCRVSVAGHERCFVVLLKVEALGIIAAADPSTHVLMLIVRRIAPWDGLDRAGNFRRIELRSCLRRDPCRWHHPSSESRPENNVLEQCT